MFTSVVSRYFRYTQVLLCRRKLGSSFLSHKNNKKGDDSCVDSMILNDSISKVSSEESVNVISEEHNDNPAFNVDEIILSSASPKYFDFKDESDGDNSNEYLDDADDDIQNQILNVALEYVPTYGWSQRAIDQAVNSLEMSQSTAGMFKRGASDLVIYFVEKCNNRLSEVLAAESNRFSGDFNKNKEVGEFVEQAIKIRLEMIIPYINTWPQAISILASPSVAADCFENGTHMIDEIWYHAGDMSTDMNWYTKRGTLAAIYIATEIFMLQDKSLNFEDTWDFLHRRMDDISSLDAMRSSLSHALSDITSLANAGVITAQNIIGFNSRNR